jgi:hypothetical protein
LIGTFASKNPSPSPAAVPPEPQKTNQISNKISTVDINLKYTMDISLIREWWM